MDASRYLVCLWPGLPELWFRGRWGGLAPAVLFAAAFNFLLVALFIYPEWLIPALVRIACWVGVCLWAMGVVRAAGRLPAMLNPRAAAESPDRYAEAREHFLRGQWSDTEAILADCLRIDPRDAQSLLMLACVYRHTERYQAAEEALGQLRRLETADPWWLEIQCEQRRLERVRKTAETEEADASKEAQASEEATESAPGARDAEPPIPDLRPSR